MGLVLAAKTHFTIALHGVGGHGDDVRLCHIGQLADVSRHVQLLKR
jgi:hypothetical protein